MCASRFFCGLILLIIGAAIGAAGMYYSGKCKTSETSISIGSPGAGAGLTITKTGNGQ